METNEYFAARRNEESERKTYTKISQKVRNKTHMIQAKPTRMELLKLKRRLKTAQRGHKLLKEKRDGLMKKFMEILRESKKKRSVLEEKISGAFKKFFLITASLLEREIEELFSLPALEIKISAKKENIMSVLIPRFTYQFEGQVKVWSDFSSPLGLEQSIEKFREALATMVELGEKEHSLRVLSFEIEKTRRRVNALEHLLLPKIEEKIKYISFKLEEQERAEKIVSLKLKEILTTKEV